MSLGTILLIIMILGICLFRGQDPETCGSPCHGRRWSWFEVIGWAAGDFGRGRGLASLLRFEGGGLEDFCSFYDGAQVLLKEMLFTNDSIPRTE